MLMRLLALTLLHHLFDALGIGLLVFGRFFPCLFGGFLRHRLFSHCGVLLIAAGESEEFDGKPNRAYKENAKAKAVPVDSRCERSEV